MKILCLIVSFGTYQDNFLIKQMDELQSSTQYNFEFVVFCTNTNALDGKNVTYSVYKKDIGFDLTLQPYIYLQQRINDLKNYDYFLYTENDILITESNINSCIKFNKKLENHGACCGFIRYEIKDGETYILDFIHPINKIVSVDGCEYICTQQNVHSGCWLLSYNQLQSISKNFIHNIGHTLEDRASNVYKSNKWPGSNWGIEKLIPKNNFSDLLVHHMPNKYVVDLNTPHGKLHMNQLINEN